MNREIKFRAKCLHNKKWAVGYYYNNGDIGVNENVLVCENWEKGSADYKRIDISTLGQFTGINDLWGKNIYEGDIVRCGYGRGEVIYHMGCYMVQWISDQPADMEFLFSRTGRQIRTDDERFEVIGNIFDNPELLQHER